MPAEARMVPPADVRTYYDRPVLKQPVWKAWIPAYFFTGGVAAGASLLAAGAQHTGRRRLAQRLRWTALAHIAVSSGFLVADLGRPGRFYNMLRVFKPSSPMNMGSWLLAAYGPLTGAAALSEAAGVLPALGSIAGDAAAVLAPGVATYTAVLTTDTAVPVWHEAGRDLPFVFAAGAAASAAAVGVLLGPAEETGPARRLAIGGALAEVAAARVMKDRLGELAEPYHEGRAGTLSSLAERCGLGGAALLTLGRRRRGLAVAGAALVAAGAAVERFAVYEAGRQSAADPKYVVGPQRRRLDTDAGARAE